MRRAAELRIPLDLDSGPIGGWLHGDRVGARLLSVWLDPCAALESARAAAGVAHATPVKGARTAAMAPGAAAARAGAPSPTSPVGDGDGIAIGPGAPPVEPPAARRAVRPQAAVTV